MLGAIICRGPYFCSFYLSAEVSFTSLLSGRILNNQAPLILQLPRNGFNIFKIAFNTKTKLRHCYFNDENNQRKEKGGCEMEIM
jgi:hypothetical protein